MLMYSSSHARFKHSNLFTVIDAGPTPWGCPRDALPARMGARPLVLALGRPRLGPDIQLRTF